MLEMKLVLAAILKKFNVEFCEETPQILETDPKSSFGMWKGDLLLNVQARN